MQIAARYGSVDMLQLLQSYGGKLSTRGPRGDTLYHLAAYNGHLTTMQWLKENSGGGVVFIESLDMYGQSVVHIAARRGELAVLQYLQHEVRAELFTQEDFDGRMPVDCIPRRGPPELQLCRDFFADFHGGVDEEQNLVMFFAKLHGIHGNDF